jgi:hypothetical protein
MRRLARSVARQMVPNLPRRQALQAAMTTPRGAPRSSRTAPKSFVFESGTRERGSTVPGPQDLSQNSLLKGRLSNGTLSWVFERVQDAHWLRASFDPGSGSRPADQGAHQGRLRKDLLGEGERRARVRSRMIDRSNSARAPKIVNTSRPPGVVVSIALVTDLNPMPRCSSPSTVSSSCFRLRASRSSFQTTRVSPFLT